MDNLIPGLAIGTGVFIFILVVVLFVHALILMVAAGMVGIIDATFGKCMLVSIISTVISVIAGLCPIIHSVQFLGFIIGLVIGAATIKYVMDTDWGKAFLAELIAIIVAAVVGCGIACIFAGSMGALMGSMG